MTTTPQVPLLTTPIEVADWLDASHPTDENFAAFNRIDDHLGGARKAMRLWAGGVELVVGRRHPDPERARCERCGRHVRRLCDGQLEAHTVPGLYDHPCHEGGS